MENQTLPGTEPVVATYTCGHGRTHRIPSDAVRILRAGTGFVAGCACGPEPLAEIPDRPHHLGGHITILGGTDDDDVWAALENLADGWYLDPDTEPVGGGETPRERRAARQ